MSLVYDSIFLSNNGTSVFTTLGFLKKIEKMCEMTKFWNVTGCSSLIIFLKLLGYKYDQTRDILSDFPLISTFINGSSLLPEDENSKRKYIKEWLISCLEDSNYFEPDINLENIYKETKIFPNFILFSRSEQKVVCLNPGNSGKTKLIDCIMASICYIGVYEEYKINRSIFSNLSSIDCFPIFYIYKEEETAPGNCLLLGNIGKFEDSENKNKLGPLSKTEGKIICQYSEYEKYKVESIFSSLDEDEIVKIYSFYRRGRLDKEEIETLFDLGMEQGSAFMKKKDTETVKDKFISKIESQN